MDLNNPRLLVMRPRQHRLCTIRVCRDIKLWPIGWLLLFGIGCQGRDSISTYVASPAKLPKSTESTTSSSGGNAEAAGEYRILAAMIPADQPVWFIRLAGPAADVESQGDHFDRFLQSIRFPDGLRGVPNWELPAGWTEEAGTDGITHARITFQDNEKRFTITVTRAGGSVQDNLRRWWVTSLGNAQRNDDDYTRYTTKMMLPGNMFALRVNMTGPKNPAAGMPKFR